MRYLTIFVKLYLATIATHLNCQGTDVYPTHMDGVDGLNCNIYTGCDGGAELVLCTGEWGHDYPFAGQYIETLKIMWDFMKAHPNTIM